MNNKRGSNILQDNGPRILRHHRKGTNSKNIEETIMENASSTVGLTDPDRNPSKGVGPVPKKGSTPTYWWGSVKGSIRPPVGEAWSKR